jgi:hypothetical protein
VSADRRRVAGSLVAGVVLVLGGAACDSVERPLLGPPPEFLQACEDVRALVTQATAMSRSAVEQPQEFAGELRQLSADLRTLAGTIEDQPLRAAVVDLAGSYQATADLTAQNRALNAPNAAEVRRSAARVDELCNGG